MPAAAIRPPLFSKGTALGRARFPLTAFGTRLGDASRTVRRPVASRRPGRRPDRRQRGPGHGVDRGGASWRPVEGDGGTGGFDRAELAGADGSPSLTGAAVRGSAAGSPRSGAGSVHWQVKAGSRAGFMVCGGIASDHPAFPPRCSHSQRTAPSSPCGSIRGGVRAMEVRILLDDVNARARLADVPARTTGLQHTRAHGLLLWNRIAVRNHAAGLAGRPSLHAAPSGL